MIRPSECEQCVPLSITTTASGLSWHTTTAHEPDCPNSPRRNQ